jgi:hypothetical protein
MSTRTEIDALLTVVHARLNGSPTSAAEWTTITRQLRQAADRARKIAKLAARMETPNTKETDR